MDSRCDETKSQESFISKGNSITNSKSFDKSLKTMVEMQNHAGKFYLFNFADL